MAKFRCGGCKRYFPQEESIKLNGVQNFCSIGCVFQTNSIIRTLPKSFTLKKKKPDIPETVRQAVLLRDKNRCRYCSKDVGIHLHHIAYRSEGGEHIEHNLIALCYRHHELIHSNKNLYKPLCLGVLWLSYVDHKHLTIPQLERFLNAEAHSSKVRQ